MDDAARRVNPVPLRALLRGRVTREEDALAEVRIAANGLADSGREHAAAQAAAERHEQARHEHEHGMLQDLIGRQHSPWRVMATRDAVERMADEAVRLAGEVSEAEQVIRQSEDMLAEARALHAARARATQKWRKTLDRIETIRGAYAVAQEEGELEDELADRHARRTPGFAPP